jgi:hypothetical protein
VILLTVFILRNAMNVLLLSLLLLTVCAAWKRVRKSTTSSDKGYRLYE